MGDVHEWRRFETTYFKDNEYVLNIHRNLSNLLSYRLEVSMSPSPKKRKKFLGMFGKDEYISEGGGVRVISSMNSNLENYLALEVDVHEHSWFAKHKPCILDDLEIIGLREVLRGAFFKR